mgnify:CR=1 FL=1
MTRSDYLSNSSKLLLICSCLLFVANALVFAGSYSDNFAHYGESFSTFCFYVVFVLGFLAFNGEGIAYKHSKERRNKKKTVLLKILLLCAFIIRYVKAPIENIVLSVSADGIAGSVLRLLLGVFNTVASYGFLFAMVSLWYIFRDNSLKKLVTFEVVAFVVGLVYNIYKVFNYSVTKYGLVALGDGFIKAFSNESLLYVLCLIEFVLCIIMFVMVLKFYDRQAIVEQEQKAKAVNNMLTARKIYSTDCYGIDTLEDDFFLD